MNTKTSESMLGQVVGSVLVIIFSALAVSAAVAAGWAAALVAAVLLVVAGHVLAPTTAVKFITFGFGAAALVGAVAVLLV